MNEHQFQRWVTDTAHAFGWQSWHVPAPMRHSVQGFVGAREAAGLPDLILIHHDPPRLVFAEIKKTGGRLTDSQQRFLQAAKAVADVACAYDESVNDYEDPCIGVYVWWPGMEEAIETLLRTRVIT